MNYLLHLLSFDSMLITSCIWCLPLWQSHHRPPLLVFLFLNYKEKAAGPPDCQTQLLIYWLQPMTVLETMDRKNTRSLHLCSSSDPGLQALILYKAPRLLMGRGPTVLEVWAYCGPLLHWLRIKGTFLFPSNFLCLFIRLPWAEKAKILVGNRSSDWFHCFGLQNHCRQWLQPWN